MKDNHANNEPNVRKKRELVEQIEHLIRNCSNSIYKNTEQQIKDNLGLIINSNADSIMTLAILEYIKKRVALHIKMRKNYIGANPLEQLDFKMERIRFVFHEADGQFNRSIPGAPSISTAKILERLLYAEIVLSLIIGFAIVLTVPHCALLMSIFALAACATAICLAEYYDIALQSKGLHKHLSDIDKALENDLEFSGALSLIKNISFSTEVRATLEKLIPLVEATAPDSESLALLLDIGTLLKAKTLSEIELVQGKYVHTNIVYMAMEAGIRFFMPRDERRLRSDLMMGLIKTIKKENFTAQAETGIHP